MSKAATPELPLLIDSEGRLPLPWLEQPLRAALQGQRGHALMLHASPGAGALPFALTLAQSWLCEAPRQPADAPSLACGHCGSCRLFQGHLHPDLLVLLPEELRQRHAWPMSGDKTEGEDSKKKPSRQIRIGEVRALIDWASKTTSRGRGKVALLHPAEAMNLQSASALLKTLEEPAPGTRLLLTVSDPGRLLPTVRSRCQPLRLALPDTESASRWLQGLGVEDAPVLLAACSGRPLDALALAQSGVDAAAWLRLPRAVAQGQAAAFSGWPVPLLLDALQKLCHDAMSTVACGAADSTGQGGGPARYFSAASLGALPGLKRAAAQRPERLAALAAWADELARVSRHAQHPWNEALLVDALVSAGAAALA